MPQLSWQSNLFLEREICFKHYWPVVVLLLFYFSFMLVMRGFMNLLLILIGLELLSWLYMLVLPSRATLAYIIIQRYFIFISILRAGILIFILMPALLLKMGLPPFHGWVLLIMLILEVPTLLFILLIHKILPILLTGKLLLSNLSLFVVVLSLLLRGCLIFQLGNLLQTVIFSSIVHSIWLVIRTLISIGFYIIYWLLYSIISILLIRGRDSKKRKLMDYNQSVLSSLAWLVISGLPPFIIFWIKINIVSWIIIIQILSYAFIFISVSVVRMSSYYRVFHLLIINKVVAPFWLIAIVRRRIMFVSPLS
jgi:hypothetical protein